LKYLYLIIISIITILILWINLKLTSESHTYSERKTDITLQLNFLENELKQNDLGNRMQGIYPEGFVFINAIYGLAWCELALCDTSDKSLKERALKEALYAYNEINSDKARKTFSRSIKPEYGIYYCGWKNYLLSKIISVDTSFTDYRIYKEKFETQCEEIKNTLTEAHTPYPESYPEKSWPADMFVAMASLSNRDKIFGQKYDTIISGWIKNVKSRLDKDNNLIPHKVDSKSGMPESGARGSSMSLMLKMLSEINPEFGKEQYKIFKEKFLSETFGIPYSREYPESESGSGDIDSGPVIFGIGFVSTIMTAGILPLYDDIELSEKQYRTLNAFGFPGISGNQKKYIFGKYPMADAFIAWGRTVELKQSGLLNNTFSVSFIKFHLISFGMLLLLWLGFFRKRIIKNK